ncbi:MAG: hypothetical protein K5891_03025 [Lachnospiraceae bacterium]|nr:hypothetical protein [Lachnospiraceae bacterium]
MKTEKYHNMLTPTFIYEEAKKRYQEVTSWKMALEKEIRQAPAGIIHIVRSGTRVQFYLRKDRSDGGGSYIRKSDTRTIRTFLRKAYQEKALKLLKKEMLSLELLLRKSGTISAQIRSLYSDYPPEIKQYLDPVDMSDADYVSKWLSQPFKGKDIPEDAAVYETRQGERVRSKSELTIANMLADRGIPYKYECPIKLGNGAVVYPDFTVLNVKTRKVFYWEHRGMMDDSDYAGQAVFKMKSMIKNGIVLGDNLIISEETSANPLGTNEIKALINRFFL